MHIVGAAEHRLRLDRYLRSARPELSRRAIEGLLRSGAVRVDGVARDARYFVKRGECVEVDSQRSRAPGTSLDPDPPRVIVASAEALVVAKPPGLTTNPALRDEPSLLDWLRDREAASPPPEGERPHPPGLLHRLDRDASGLVLFSRTPGAHRALLAGFRAHEVAREYLTLVAGRAPREGTCELPLARTARGRMAVRPGGLPASTRFARLRAGERASLLRVRPETGRMHQIRAHLAALGHPVAGDPLYGDPRSGLGAPRLWLHAERLRLPPDLADRLRLPSRIECPLWADLAGHLEALGWSVPAGEA